jgi:predicted transcriptional regulator
MPIVPSGAFTARLNPRQRARLVRLARMIDATQAQAMNEAVTHYLASLELREPIHRTVPSEEHTETTNAS